MFCSFWIWYINMHRNSYKCVFCVTIATGYISHRIVIQLVFRLSTVSRGLIFAWNDNISLSKTISVEDPLNHTHLQPIIPKFYAYDVRNMTTVKIIKPLRGISSLSAYKIEAIFSHRAHIKQLYLRAKWQGKLQKWPCWTMGSLYDWSAPISGSKDTIASDQNLIDVVNKS